MNDDPVYRKILERLGGHVDGDKFEACAQDLLGQPYPNLAPVVGGSDDGMDAAFGTEDGAFPLVCTTRPDVIGNFRKNVTTYLKRKSGPRRVVIATTQHLTPAKKRNLEVAATELGVTLVNIHDRADFANRLYRHPKWRMGLLGVPGDVPALSALPPRGRYVSAESIIGREEVLEWLRTTGGDLLVVGSPGAGKTCLHQHLANNGFCLFVVDHDPSRLADAIREQQPSVVVVDDAHTRIDVLLTVRRLRSELSVEFAIHANCWPRHDGTVRQRMGISPEMSRTLRPLTREMILEVVLRCGIAGPEPLLDLLVQQADGKPGLAVALCEACKRDGIERVWNGEELAETLLENPELISRDTSRAVLAAFALGGDAGMSLYSVATGLGLPPVIVREVSTGLGAGGVVEEVGEDRLQVRPPALRGVLARDVFFGDAHSLDATQLLNLSSSVADTAHVLIDALQRGGKVPASLIRSFAERADKRDVWRHLGWANENYARLIVDDYPTKAVDASEGPLHFIPDRILQLLLRSIRFDSMSSKAETAERCRPIHEWLTPDPVVPGEATKRRKLLMTAIEQEYRGGILGDEPCAWAMAEILRYAFHRSAMKAGSLRTVMFTRGMLPLQDIRGIIELWPRALRLLTSLTVRAQRAVLDEIENWCFPGRFTFQLEVDDQAIALIRTHSVRMLKDVWALATSGTAYRLWAHNIATTSKLDETFEEPSGLSSTLFAQREHGLDWKTQSDRRDAELQRVAEELARRPAAAAVAELASIEHDMTEFGGLPGGYDRASLYYHISRRVADPHSWIEHLITRGMKPEFVAAFLRPDGFAASGEYHTLLHRLIAEPDYRQLAVVRVLQLSTPPEPLLKLALLHLTPPAGNQDHFLVGLVIPSDTAKRLLAHTDPAIRAAMALGEWIREPHGQVRREIFEQWRGAVLDIDGQEHFLDEIFRSDSKLGFDWARARMKDARHDLWRSSRGIQLASNCLDREQRRQLLHVFTRDNYDDESFDSLLKDDPVLFRDWLAVQPDKYLRLCPLDRIAGPRWVPLAIAALECGVTEQELVRHCTPNRWGGMGPLSEHFRAVIPIYERLLQHEDHRLRAAGKWGLEYVRGQYEREKSREYEEEVRGL